ncbi:uncharacterized protein EI90DRAFT_3118307 [Cantharellus anzutake]|uniref:uncharacterized protein n=1 Tax=Cantharellus anzutake TaxID=1750568 RepID=UPI001903C069|nr:uncharacterized protein EI90DRAFT_3118307 [Cantharellus anzutake]KAF8337873.1 hypothetical protein EI90DRAFT_3118307 [Cantharellus anzutake]
MLLKSILALPTLLGDLLSWGYSLRVPEQQTLQVHQSPKRVAVIGAGTSGLSFLKVVKDYKEEYDLDWDVVLFEKRHDVGGIWLKQEEKPGPDRASSGCLPETPLYPGVSTSTPNPYNTLPGLPFPPGFDLYLPEQEMYNYHRNLFEIVLKKDFEQKIKWQHEVTKARWVGTAESGQWELTIQTPKSGGSAQRFRSSFSAACTPESGKETIQEKFDHLIVAVGQTAYPRTDKPPGMDKWLSKNYENSTLPRQIQHSMYYMSPKSYAGRTVLVAGAGGAGEDVARDVRRRAKKVYIARSSTNPCPRASDPTPVGRLTHFEEDAVCFDGGTGCKDDIDSVILAIGYETKIPFLMTGGALMEHRESVSCDTSDIDDPKLSTNGNYIRPLYKHTMSLSSDFPPDSLFILGLPRDFPPALLAVAQSIFATRVIKDKSLVDRDALFRELVYEEKRQCSKCEGQEERCKFDPFQLGHRLVEVAERDEFNVLMNGLIDVLKQKCATELPPLPGTGDRFVDDRRLRVNRRSMIPRIKCYWDNLEDDEREKLLKGRVNEDAWFKLVNDLIVLSDPMNQCKKATGGIQDV